MSLELMILGFGLMALCAGLATAFLIAFYKEKYVRALVLKGLASLCFVIFGAVSCFTGGPTVITVITLIGLCFGLVGDEFIALYEVFPEHKNRAFVSGGVTFITGHFLYAAALIIIGGPDWLLLIATAVIINAIGGIYARRKDFLNCEMRVPLTLYLGVVILVTAIATAIFAKSGALTVGLFAVGGALFTVSDNLLFAYKFGKRQSFKQNIALHVTYYLAQFAIAWSIAIG